jgi:hypothetical protein
MSALGGGFNRQVTWLCAECGSDGRPNDAKFRAHLPQSNPESRTSGPNMRVVVPFGSPFWQLRLVRIFSEDHVPVQILPVLVFGFLFARAL